MWEKVVPALQAQVRERQRITIENYGNDPDLLAEHVGMEDNFQAGGYGERQIEELLQNAIDQLTVPGRVELRLADGVLYCANEGSPFGAEGIKAVTGAFLSSKKDEKIGRFGLGFKSVLGVSDRPQILSRSISFGFNEPEATQLLASLPYHPERVPTLRVPSVLDPNAIASEDANVAEMMKWASTIVKLPLVRGGDRLRRRLQEFDVRYLLFPERLAQVDVTLDAGTGLSTRVFRRSPAGEVDLIRLEPPEADASVWRVLHRNHKVSDGIAATLPGLFHRENVTISYALEQGKTGIGEFWAWFPLLDQTTASGIFNAPWQVNDDRTSLLPGSELNLELLEVAAELLIDAALLESTPSDPAKHFDVLPARGRETRSNADRYMSERIPQLARQHELIPTSRGTMRAPSKVRAPIVQNATDQISFALPAEAIRRWAESTGTDDTPHWSCYATPTRAARLGQLLTDENDRPACKTLPPTGWLHEVAKARTIDSIDAALSIFLRLKDEKEETWKQFVGALILPLADNSFAALRDAATVLLPVEGAASPEQVKLIGPEFAAESSVRTKLIAVGVREISPDEVISAAAASARVSWEESDWKQLWSALAEANPAAGREAISGIVARQIPIQLPTRAGNWRPAGEVFVDQTSVPGVASRQVDITRIGGRTDLAAAAGCLSAPRQDFPIHTEHAFAKYADVMRREMDEEVKKQYGAGKKGTLRFEDPIGVGPLDVLLELAESKDPTAADAIARWSTQVLRMMRFDQISVPLDFAGKAKQQKVGMKSPELWCVEAFGLLDSSLGPQKLTAVMAHDLQRFGEILPVALESYGGLYSLPADAAKIPVDVLRDAMSREGYKLTAPERLGELLGLCAPRAQLASLVSLPAVDPASGVVRITPVANVVLATLEELEDLGSHNLTYIPSGPWDEVIVKAWAVQRAADVVAKTIDWTPLGESVPLLDVYPTLGRAISTSVNDIALRRCSSIVRRTTSPSGVKELRLSSHLDGQTILVDDELDEVEVLLVASASLRLGINRSDAESIVKQDESLRRSRLVLEVQGEVTEPSKLLKLVGRDGLVENLPHGLLDIIERRQGGQTDLEVAELFFTTRGNDSLRRLKEALLQRGLPVPRTWDGTPEAEQFVTMLGFPRAFAGTREKKAPPVEVVPGKVELDPLHDFQEKLSEQIRELVLIRDKDGQNRRGLLYLPTGAGKTRVTCESIAAMMRDDELGSPILWIAQSEELCEQAIQSWTEVWRAIGDRRPMEITRYWGKYEADESLHELQVVVATDAKLAQMIGNEPNRAAHAWLQNAPLVVIDEAHRAGSRIYTEILRWLGITAGAGAHTDRPLLGLTATPYRGTNEEINRQFALRFGNRRLNALDEDDPIGQLRDMKVLARVEHQILDGIEVGDSPTEGQGGSIAWDDVSRVILEKLGENMDRTQLLVDHILRQDDTWPILVFTPSVLSAHVTAALIRSLGRTAGAVDGEMRGQERRRKIEDFKAGEIRVLVNCDLLTQGFDAPKVRALYIARPTFSPNRYVQMVGRGLRGPRNGGTEACLVVNVVDTFTQFDRELAYREFDHLWTKKGAKSK